MNYIVGIRNCKIIVMPCKCIFGKSDLDLEISVFREGHNCNYDVGTKEYLLEKYKELEITDFDD